MKDKMIKGLGLEAKFSQIYHQKHVPILLSAKILRSWGMGQTDIAVYDPKGKESVIYEVKNRPHVSDKQRYRLRKTGWLLQQLLKTPCKLKIISGDGNELPLT